jgi:hypothetical protein
MQSFPQIEHSARSDILWGETTDISRSEGLSYNGEIEVRVRVEFKRIDIYRQAESKSSIV